MLESVPRRPRGRPIAPLPAKLSGGRVAPDGADTTEGARILRALREYEPPTYHCARVERDAQRPSGRTLVLENLKHSYVDLDDPRRLEFDYVRWIGDAIDGAGARGAPLEGVFFGGAGFTLPRYLLATRPGSRARVLEVDGELTQLARKRLGLRTGRDLRAVTGDAFSARAVPWHLATVEFAEEIRRVLRPRGVYALNVIDQPPLKLLRAEAATLLEAFGDVALVAPRGAGEGAGLVGGNFVLLASEAGLPADQLVSRG